jgi:hypothetical protein
MSAVEVSERSRAIVVAEELATLLEKVDELLAAFGIAQYSIRRFADGDGADCRAYRDCAIRLAALRRVVDRTVPSEVATMLGRLDDIYGISAEVDW